MALRRTSVAFADAIERSREIYGPLGGRYNESKLTWRMPNGGRVAFGYLENVGDAMAYQGRNLTDCWVEEAGTYPAPDPIDRMFGTLRSAHDVPVQLILTGNPGGPGQHWLAQRYRLIPFPTAPKVFERVLPNGKRHQVAVVPAKISDNAILMQRDPSYIDRLPVRSWSRPGSRATSRPSKASFSRCGRNPSTSCAACHCLTIGCASVPWTGAAPHPSASAGTA